MTYTMKCKSLLRAEATAVNKIDTTLPLTTQILVMPTDKKQRFLNCSVIEDQEHHLELSTILSLQLSSSKWQSTELITDRFIHEKRMDIVIPMFQEGRLGWECQHDLPKENAPSGSIEVLKRKVLNWFVNVLISSGNRGASWRHWKVPVSKDACPGCRRYETSSCPQ